jgi:hypothetical protein
MPIRIATNQVQNLQQIEAVIAGPEGANRLFTVAGQFDVQLSAFGSAQFVQPQKETFSVLIGPVLTRQGFFRAISTASLSKTNIGLQGAPGDFNFGISDIDADWDDETGQVELKIEVFVNAVGAGNVTTINGLAFQTTILAAV